MTMGAHLWAIGYDDPARAWQARDVLARLAWDNGQASRYLILLDLAVVSRNAEGSFTLDRAPFPTVGNILTCSGVGFLVGLVLAAPLTGATIGALLGSAGSAASTHVGIPEDFIEAVEALMKPGMSVLFVLDQDVDMEAIQHTIRGLGGTVLKTNVDLQRAKEIQSMLAASTASIKVESQ